MADLLELGRSGQIRELEAHAQAAGGSAAWDAASALELACAWLLAGDPRQADLAYLQADALDPSLALVPDVWGLWPAPAASAEGLQREAALRWAICWRAWRQPDVQAQWQQLWPRLQSDWRLALEPEGRDALLILGRASADPAAPPLDPPLETELARLVDDAEIASEPSASCRYWQLLAEIRPKWGLARIRAADLALARGELEASGRWVADPPAEALANPWFHDVAARHAVQCGALDSSLDSWAEAIQIAQAQGSSNLVDMFEQRRREARRGPGVLQVRSLANRGDRESARRLLERLLADDPQWQPLRNLQEQLREAEVPASRRPSETSSPSPLELEAFTHLLDRATLRLQALGAPIPEPDGLQDPGPDGAAAELEAWSRRLSDYEARYALA